MKSRFINFLLSGIVIVLLLPGITGNLFSQAVPEFMYYKFDAAGNQQNYASAPVGTNPAVLDGQTVGNTGQFGTALVGNGLSSGTNRLNTGWSTNLPSTGWTISFWVNNFPATAATTYYYFGDASAGSFRCFTGGVAGNGNLWLRGTGFTDVPINAIPSTPTVIHLVYTGSAVRVFFNGVFNSSVAQGAVTFSGAGPFLVGGYSTSNSINAGTLMDEFRMYNRALTDAEVTATWNQSLPVIVAGPPIVTTLAATALTGSTATLNGTANANGDNTAVSFEYGLTTAYGSTATGIPAVVTGTSVTPVLANITGLLPGNTYHFRVKGVNAFGTTYGTDMTFITPAVLPIVITGAATGVTSTTATLNGTVNAGGASTTVTFEYGLSTAYGTTVPGVPPTVTGNAITPVSANITGLVINTTYHYRVNGVNTAGPVNGNDMTFITTSCPMPGAPGTITGPMVVCGNSPGNVYSVAPILNATGYTWTIPIGAAITAGANTNSITVTMGNSSGSVTVFGTNTCGSGSVSTLPVTVNLSPVPTITGYTTMCVNIGPLDYVTEPGMTNYVWTVSPGNTITGGQGTKQVQVSWTTSGAQWVAVNYNGASGCSAGTPTQLSVTVQPLPGSAGAITGTAAVCGGATGISYSVGAITNAASYVWILPPGASIATGAGTNNITVNFDNLASSGDIKVYGNNPCGNGTTSSPLAVTVTPLPGNAGVITGEAAVCQGETGIIYSVEPIANATGYMWTVPAGATIVSGSNTNSITVDYTLTAVSGMITVYGTNSCGNGTNSPDFSVTVNEIPPAPVITVTDDIILHSNAAAGNQWYFEGAPISGATGQDYIAEQTGEYWCIVTLNGCSSGQSNHIIVTMTGTGTLQSAEISLFPVPNDGRFTVSITSPVQEIFTIQVFNNLSVMITEINGIEVNGKAEKVIDLRPVTAGIYTAIIRSDHSRIVKKVLVTK
jgi:hypothetical protein